MSKNPTFKLSKNCIRVGIGCWVVRSRIVGAFSMQIKKVRLLSKKFDSNEKLWDICGRTKKKSLILLDDGTAILSPFLITTISKDLEETKDVI